MRESRVQVTLKEYLEKLRRVESAKSKGRYVPTMVDIARESGISFVTINRLANQHNKQVKFETMAHIIKGVRSFGFNTQVADLLTYTEV